MKDNKEWSQDDMFFLIDLYKEKPRLWDPSHKEYKLKTKRYDDWKEISNIVDCDVNDIKKKMESLLTSFRRERQRCEGSKKSGAGRDEIYNSKWFAFEKMKFLLDKFTPRVTVDTMDTGEISVEDNADNEDLNNSIPSTSKAFKSPKKLKLAKNSMLNQRAEEAYINMQQAIKRRNERDSSTTFGEHVGNKHRTYSSHTKSMVEHLIGNILFEADMGKYESNYDFYADPIHSPMSRDSVHPYRITSSPAHQPPSRTPTPTSRDSLQKFFKTSSPAPHQPPSRTPAPTSRDSLQTFFRKSSSAHHLSSKTPTPTSDSSQSYFRASSPAMFIPEEQNATFPSHNDNTADISYEEDITDNNVVYITSDNN